PFVRPYEWSLLPDQERRELLAEHGRMARGYPDVRANTVASFGLSDYEGVLPVEGARRARILDTRVRGRLPAPDRGPDACPARARRPPARPRGGPVLHRPPPLDQRDPGNI